MFFRTKPSSAWWGWAFLERTRILCGIQFTRHSIGFVVVETTWFIGSNVNVILTQQTWGQRSIMSAGSKRWALAFYFPIRICYIFPISRCRGESNLGLWPTSVLAKRMPLCICEFRQILRPNTFFIGIRQCSLPFSLQVPKLCTDLDLPSSTFW